MGRLCDQGVKTGGFAVADFGQVCMLVDRMVSFFDGNRARTQRLAHLTLFGAQDFLQHRRLNLDLGT
jgi:hypothetical protein